MKLNRLFLLLILFQVFSCSKESENNRMHEFVMTQEHDQRLLGWWKCVQYNDQCLYFDGAPNYQMIGAILNSSGAYTEQHDGHYWYTDNGFLFSLKDATPLTGIISSKSEYNISEDNTCILMKDSDGNYYQAYIKIDHP